MGGTLWAPCAQDGQQPRWRVKAPSSDGHSQRERFSSDRPEQPGRLAHPSTRRRAGEVDPLAGVAIGQDVFSAEKIHGDDTAVPALAPGFGQTNRSAVVSYDGAKSVGA
jgi:hypothetical protein